MHIDAGNPHGRLQRLDGAGRETERVIGIRVDAAAAAGVGSGDGIGHHDEFVAAEARHRVDGARHAREPARDFLQ